MEFEKDLKVEQTGIPGLFVLDLSVMGDNRGWFKENWQRSKMIKLGIPDINIIQNNISFNTKRGTTRGIHAEPWDKFISIAKGRVFGAWVDLRQGENFGKVFTCELDPSKAIFVPRGVGNSFQTLEDDTVYTYLVNAHWSKELKKSYTFLNLADPTVDIRWPIDLENAEISLADCHHPMLEEVVPMPPKRIFVTGSKGQLGRAIFKYVNKNGIAGVDFHDIDTFDMSDPEAYRKINWSQYSTIINAGAYTAVDKAETSDGRIACWKANAQGPALLAKTAREHDITMIHISSDYVFDGSEREHKEEEVFSPLGVYGQSKAAGDIAVGSIPKHYILRSSWVIGDGHNFVKTMVSLSKRCADPNDQLNKVTVVNDQFGRLTFTSEMVKAIFTLIGINAPYGTYNVTGSGKIKSWFEIAQKIFQVTSGNADAVIPVSTEEYAKSSSGLVAPRPTYSVLSLDKICDVGFKPRDWEEDLIQYINTTNC